MPPFLEKRPSQIHGQGIFATSRIKIGQIFYTVPIEELSSRPRSQYAKIGDHKWVNDPAVLNWINHSCNPNAELVLIQDESPKLRAIRIIAPNEEITVDYNKTEIEGANTICLCGAKNCGGYFLVVRVISTHK